MKYALKLTSGDDVKILQVFEDKASAMVAGTEYRKTISRDAGLLALIEGEFYSDGKMISPSYKLHEVIR